MLRISLTNLLMNIHASHEFVHCPLNKLFYLKRIIIQDPVVNILCMTIYIKFTHRNLIAIEKLLFKSCNIVTLRVIKLFF